MIIQQKNIDSYCLIIKIKIAYQFYYRSSYIKDI